MQLKELFKTEESDRAVSPVIGVILMVAITVILAAVIGTFVLGLGDQVQQTSPNAQWNWDYDDSDNDGDGGYLRVTHEGGDSIDRSTLRMTLSGATNNNTDQKWTLNQNQGAESISAGDSMELNGTGTSAYSAADDSAYAAGEFDSATVRLIWTAEGGGSSTTLTTWEGPDA